MRDWKKTLEIAGVLASILAAIVGIAPALKRLVSIEPERAVERRVDPPAEAYPSLEDIPTLFDPLTGAPLARYCGSPEGGIELVGATVEFSPTTGERCKPLTREIVARIRGAKAEDAAEAERRANADAERRARAERERAVEEEARRERAFRERFVNVGALSQVNASQDPTFLVFSDPAGSLTSRVAAALRERGITVAPKVLRPSVFEPDVVDRFLGGDQRLFSRLGLTSGHLLLGREEYSAPNQTSVRGVVNVQGHLTVSVVPLSGGVPTTLPTLHEVGAGIDESRAREAAEKRLVEALLAQPDIGPLLR